MSDTYNKNGFTVMTSQFLKKRGYCCKSACLHCPYGHAIKQHRLTFADVNQETIEQLRGQFDFDLEHYALADFQQILLKGNMVGVMRKNHIQIKELYLLEEFREQGISKELVESYYFY